MKILVFGEIIWDVYPNHSVIGGAPLNFAGHCAICGHDSFLFSSVGKDDLGTTALNALHDFHINADFIQRCDKKTGQCLVTLDENAIPSYYVVPDVAYDNISNPDTEKINREKFDAFYFGTLAQRKDTSRQALLRILKACTFKEIFCDLNLRDGCYDEQSVKNCLEYATVLKFSDEEMPRLEVYDFWRKTSQNSIIKELFSAYPQIKVVLLTKGKEGACVYTRDGRTYTISSTPCQVVSTVGAGDSFSAVWLSRYLDGDDEKTAALVASKVSGYVVSVVDALPRYDIASFL